MSLLLLIWLVLASVAEHVLALTPASIEHPLKRVLYYLIVTPEIGLSYLKTVTGKFPFTWLGFSTWFRM